MATGDGERQLRSTGGEPAAVSGNTFNADNGMTGFNGTTLSYDANGNLTGDQVNTYTWNNRHQLSGISGGATASFVYDALGRRMNKTIGGITTQFLYDRRNPVQDLNSTGGVNANLLTGLGIDEYFTRTASGSTSTLLADALGSTIGLVGSSPSIATSYTYQPFGATTSVGAANTNPYQFTGRENDATGLYFYRARYYHPTFQRFIAQDPIGFGGGDVNMYAYVGEDPLDEVDLLGLRPLTGCEKSKLAPYIPQTDLNNADLHTDGVPWYTPSWASGITRNNDIYFRPGAYDPTTTEGLALLGHELVHVGQYRNGMNWVDYFAASLLGYSNNGYETQAYATQNAIEQGLFGGGSCPCQ